MICPSPKLVRKQSLNSPLQKIPCSKRWNCKRMTCQSCKSTRREYFVNCGLLFGKQWQLDTFVTISWKWIDGWENSWYVAINNMDKLSKNLNSKRIRPYIRVLAVGSKNCPHVHFSLTKTHLQKLIKVVAQVWRREEVDIQIKPIHNLKKLMGYFFDQNYLVSQLDPDRTKGVRLITASRPMPCGFPTKRSSELVDQFLDELSFALPLPLMEFNKHVLRFKRTGGVK